MDVRVNIYKKGSQDIYFLGEITGDEIALKELHFDNAPGAVVRNEVFTFPARLSLKKTWLEEITPNDYKFKPIDKNIVLRATLAFKVSASMPSTVQPVEFFGTYFDLNLGASLDLTLCLPSLSGSADKPFFSLEACGYISLDGGTTSFISEAICFEVFVEKFDVPVPKLSIELPDIGFNLPKLSLPWDISKIIPAPPFRFPPLSIQFGELPVKVSWKTLEIKFDTAAKKLLFDIKGLTLSGLGGEIEGDARIVIQDGAIVFAESFIDIKRPVLNKIFFEAWHFDENCLLLKWKEKQLKMWLRLLSADLSETDIADTEVTLRLLRSREGFREARLDWKKEDTKREFTLPGLQIEFPKAKFYTLLFSYDFEQKPHLTLFSTLEKDAAANAFSTFTFGRSSDEGSKRELLNEEKKDSSKLIELTATARHENGVSVAMMDLPFDGTAKFPTFFKQTEEPLTPLSELLSNTAPAICQPTDNDLKPLSKKWEIALKLNLPSDEFTLPFLKGAGQAFKIKRARDENGNIIEPVLDSEKFLFNLPLDVEVSIGDSFKITSRINSEFGWERFSLKIDDSQGIKFTSAKPLDTNFLGLDFHFQPNKTGELFRLVTKGGNYQLLQSKDSEITAKYTGATSKDNPITFALQDFKITPAGVSVKGTVTNSPVMLNGIRTKFQFTKGEFSIEDNRLAEFAIHGSGPLPPDLVGDANVDIHLRFKQEKNGRIFLSDGGAKLSGKNLLECKSTRFDFTINGIELVVKSDGNDTDLYFAISGNARFKLADSDSKSGPLAWLPAIEINFLNCPLAGDGKIFSKHKVNVLVELKEKPKFDFLGCFKMELRGIGFVPQFDKFDGDAAMQLSGQLMFADGAGDMIDSKIECHSLYIGLPEAGSFIPRIHFKDLSVKIKVGDAFSLEGAVEFLDDKQKGIEGFYGKGVLGIKGLPEITVAFAFVRIRRDADGAILRAWFLNINAGKLSYRTPLFGIVLREIGLGFGYRYTLTSISEALKLEDDPRALIAKLKVLSRSQGELSRLDQWSPDLEAPGQNPYWTVVARALFAQTSAAGSVTDWNQKKEAELPCLFVMDLVLAMRSDLTFLMTGRGWLATNYNDYLTKESLKTSPLFSGFVLLSPRRPRFLAHLSSNPGAEFGDHPPLPEFLKRAIKNSRFSATMLIEPGLLHYELGWANMLQWSDSIGPLRADFRGGVIFRLSRSEVVYGVSFLARGSLELAAKAGGKSLGARFSATANVAFGARFIAVLGLQNPLGRSALYGGIGLEINVRVSIEFWLRLKIGFIKISINLRFSLSLSFTASLEVGVTGSNAIGVRGTAAVQVRIMGRGLQLKVKVGLNEAAVNNAFAITSQYLNIGLEATETEPIPGTQGLQTANVSPPHIANSTNAVAEPMASAIALPLASVAETNDLPLVDVAETNDLINAVESADESFVAPHYTIFSIPVSEKGEDGKEKQNCYFLLFPNEKATDEKATGDKRQGFLPVSPTEINLKDFEWNIPSLNIGSLKQFNYISGKFDKNVAGNTIYQWEANWQQKMGEYQWVGKNEQGDEVVHKPDLTLDKLLNQSFIPKTTTTPDNDDPFKYIIPEKDPILPWEEILSSMEDYRVYNPSEDAFEAAVRGATEQFAASPCFRRDPNSIYEQHLTNAFSDRTSIYSENGETRNEDEIEENDDPTEAEVMEQVLQMRSMIVGQMITDLQNYAEALKNGKNTDELVKKSVAFQSGLIFKTEDGIPDWIQEPSSAGEIKQRIKRNANEFSTGRDVKPFNTKQTNFKENPPQFQRVQHFTDSNTIAITWDLIWSEKSIGLLKTANYSDEQTDPEQHLKHYHVRRRALSGKEREVEYEMKMGEALNVPTITGKMTVGLGADKKRLEFKDGGLDRLFKKGQKVNISGCSDVKNNVVKIIAEISSTDIIFTEGFNSFQEVEKLLIVSKAIQPLRSRFQFVDNFNEETAEDQAAISAAGRSYIYTITPVDVTGTPGTSPLTVVATRFPSEPPQVPADGELTVNYNFSDQTFKSNIKTPLPLKPEKILLQWTEFPDPPNKPPVAIGRYNLIFRKEIAFPVGSYGVDSDSAGGNSNGFPVSNARKLRTDKIIVIERERIKVKTELNQKKCRVEIDLAELVNKGIINGEVKNSGEVVLKEWRPEAWEIFFQTESPAKVASSLTPMQIVLEFINAEKKTVTRRPERLEWITQPLAFEVLPPEDEKADVGFANVPMPKFKDSGVIGEWLGNVESELEYNSHPEGLRSLRFEWNQGASENPDYPTDMQAGFRVFEFDTDAHLWKDEPPKDLFDQMRRIQEVEVLSGENAAVRPATTVVANQWEAWYPSTMRRLQTAKKVETDKSSKTKLSSWYSSRDSYLEWADDRNMFAREGDALVACSAEGTMIIDSTASKITGKAGIFKDFKVGQPAQITSIFNDKINGTYTVKTIDAEFKELGFEKDVFKAIGNEPITIPLIIPLLINGLFATLTIEAKGKMTLKAANSSITATGKIFENFEKGQRVEVSGASEQANNGKKTVVEVSSDFKTIKLNETLKDEADANLTIAVLLDNLTIDSFIIKSRCEIKDQTLTCQDGGLKIYSPGQYVRISGAVKPQNNGVKRIKELVVETDGTEKLVFAAGSFVEDDICEKLDGSPFTTLHPWLAQIVSELDNSELDNDDKTIVVVNPPPSAQPEELNALLAQATPRQDPYGWNILKHMGLSVTFLLRDQRTGKHLTFEKIKDKLKTVIENFTVTNKELKKHLFIEYLFQPAKSVRLENEEKGAKQNDLLAVIQISLRPLVKPEYHYFLYETSSEKADQAFDFEIEPNGAYTLIELSQNTVPIDCKPDEKNRSGNASGESRITFLIRTTSNEAPKITIKLKSLDDTPPKKPELTINKLFATNRLTTYFTSADWSSENFLTKHEDCFVQWQRFRRYLLRYNAPNPASAEIPKLEAPQPTKKEDFNKLLGWLSRFFEHSGDILEDKVSSNSWCAAAYPRALSPIGVTPDQIGRMNFYYLTEYQYASSKRYYIQPSGRYDAFWQALAQSKTLYPDDKQRENNLKALNPIILPNMNNGGLDVILDRIHEIAAPAILFSGRLDAQPAGGELAVPGKTWEVAIAKHPEQSLIEKNRTLMRQLDYRQMAHTLLRRFAFADKLTALDAAMEDYDVQGNLQFIEPNEINLPVKYEPEKDENEHRLFEKLTDRIGGFGTNAFVLQWESLPYFYENRLLLIAQTSTVVSPVTEVIQREFEYHSPVPTAFAEGANNTNLSVKIALNSYWDCTPESVTERWKNEKREPSDEKRKLSSLPDTDVIYDLVLEFSADLTETQVEIYFRKKEVENDPPSGYYAREVGTKLKLADSTKPIKILPPHSEFNKTDNFVLETELKAVSTDEKPLNVQPIGGKTDFANAAFQPKFERPEAFVLLWDGEVSKAEIEKLRQFQQAKEVDWDNSFANAFAQLIKKLVSKTGAGVEITEALIGLEQLPEITGKVELPKLQNGKHLIWRGGCDEQELKDLKFWENRYEYQTICNDLIKKLEITEIEFLTDGGTLPVIPAELPDILKDRFRIEILSPETSKIIFKRLTFANPEIDALKTLRDNAVLSQTFRDAVGVLIETLESGEIKIPASNYLARPSASDLPQELREKLLIAKGLIGFRGWMTKATANELLNSQTGKPANQKSIERLFNDSISRGFSNGILKITARRGAAKLEHRNIKSDLKEKN